MLPGRAKLTIGGTHRRHLWHLHVGRGQASEPTAGARASHLSAGLGKALGRLATRSPLGPDNSRETAANCRVTVAFTGHAYGRGHMQDRSLYP